MEKEKADVIITEYLGKIYGFAYRKSFSYGEAEELAAEMAAEVYRSLRKQDEVVNPDGYVWRICEHAYAKYVAQVKKHRGVSIDEAAGIPYFDPEPDDGGEIRRLRREIAYLSASRRNIVFRFYYGNESVREIAGRLSIPEGTVKWHLNRARNELKEGLKMERIKGSLGINPIVATEFGHSGSVGTKGGPEYYLGDRLSLNIVYSVYFEPKNTEEIAEELGVTPVFIEDKIAVLENNGYLVRTNGGRFTTYVNFTPRRYSKERGDAVMKMKLEAAKALIKEYVPAVRAAVADLECFIPGGNRQLLDAAAILYGATCKCGIKRERRPDLSRYYMSNLDGGRYIAYVNVESECSDPEYVPTAPDDYDACGSMGRASAKYPAVGSWSIDSKFDSRTDGWKNNNTSDYEYLYEFITGKLGDPVADSCKLDRLRERGFIDGDGGVGIMIARESGEAFSDRIPSLDEAVAKRFAPFALEAALERAKDYPPQMQDLIVDGNMDLIDRTVGLMTLDLLYADGTFRPLTEKERVTANLIMFSDVLPE